MTDSPPQPPTADTHVRTDPRDVDELLDTGVRLHLAGDTVLAQQAYMRALELQPDQPRAMQLLAVIEGERGNASAALALLQQAAVRNPDDGPSHHNLARALDAAEQHGPALAAYYRAHLLQPAHTGVMEEMGLLLIRMDRMQDALACFDRALQVDPMLVSAMRQRGEVLQHLVRSDPSRRDETIAALQALQPHVADREGLEFTLAALGGGAPPPAMPADSVARLFDRYATSFEEHLTVTLQYRTPQQVQAALQRVQAESGPLPRGRVIDLGCGTGLCAPFLRPLAQELVGVDLSRGMLEQAARRNAYDRLACGELVAFLRAAPHGVALAVAADVFVYIGDLDPVFHAVASVLKGGGYFVFSVEDPGDLADEPGYELRRTRRYVHGRAYVLELARRHGLRPADVQPVVLRTEAHADVPGVVYALRRL